MANRSNDVGVTFPTVEVEHDAGAIREFAQAVEDLGFSHLMAYDRVLAVNPINRPDWASVSPYTHESPFQEPLVLLSYLAGLTRTIKLVTGVVVLPQRQTLLFAKQAANLDRYCNGRLRLGVGLGHNAVEYKAMGVPYQGRAARLEEQIHFLRRLWTEQWFSETTGFHEIVDAGICPLPIQRPIPIWIGVSAPAALDRAARIGDALLCYRDVSQAAETVSGFRAAVQKHGRDPDQIRVVNNIIQGMLGAPHYSPEELALCVDTWRTAGARAVNLHTMDIGLRGVDRHLAYLRNVAQALELGRQAK
ncbi:MAG: TIGR03619 family F420-dependent LLM class oxidoreductase [Candidatus Binatia bacterium]